MHRNFFALGLVVFLALGCGRANARRAEPPTNAPVPLEASSSGCGKTFAKGETLGTLTSSGVQRTYRLYVPASYSPSQPTALVLNFHGFGSTAKEQEAYSKMPQQADKSGFITVAPDGLDHRWFIYSKLEPGYVDDFAFVSSLIDDLSSKLCIDSKRVFSTGISNGAAFSAQAACKLNDRIAAISTVAAEGYNAVYCSGKQPVPILAFHGTADKLVPFDGGPSGRLGLTSPPTRTNMANWAKFNGCNMTLATQQIASDVSLESYSQCRNNADTQLYVIDGGGHTWPGAINVLALGPTTHSIDATALMAAFFAAHPKP